MNIRLTPRGLGALKTLAGEAGMRPGELVTRWVEERLEAERGGASAEPMRTALDARIDALSARIDALESRSTDATSRPPRADVAGDAPAASTSTAAATDPAETPAPRRRGRPPKTATAATSRTTPAKRGRPRKAATAGSGKRVPLHQEIIAVITERGPQTAADLAVAITERGVFTPPRSGKPLDAASVNSRVSNPVYRDRFARDGHRITLA